MSGYLSQSSFPTLFQNIVENAPIRIFWKDCDSRYLGCNTLFAADAGFSSPEALIGKTDFDTVWKDQAAGYVADDKFIMESGAPKLDYEELQSLGNGQVRWIQTSKVPLRNAEQQVIGILGIFSDISTRKQAEQTEKKLNRALRLLSECNMALAHADDERSLLTEICRLIVETGAYRMAWVGFAQNDIDKTVLAVAQYGDHDAYLDRVKVVWAETEFGRGPTGTAIRTAEVVVNQDYQNNPSMEPWRKEADKQGYRSSVAIPVVLRKRVAGALTIYAQEPCAFDSNEQALLRELATNLGYGIDALRTRSEHHSATKQLEFLVHHDPLTGLPNRLLLQDRFEQLTAIAEREKSGVAVFVLDLDNFKLINDSLGRSWGDQLLAHIAKRLRACIRNTDTISRLGGDEFVILLSNVDNISIIEAIVVNIIEAFVEPFCINGHTLSASFSIGIGLWPNDGREFDTLLKQADMALYHAKEAGRNTYRFFSEEMHNEAIEHLTLQGQLRNAITDQELVLHYQPQIDIESGRIVGAEALVRWQHPKLGLVPPNNFIPLAERSGLIIPIGEWVLNEACRQAQVWRTLEGMPQMTMAVNLSALQFKRGNVLETVMNALEKSGLPAKCLELELTESILISDTELVMRTLRSLKEIGVKLSIDDFGTGYSGLAYLKRLSVDKLKIDRSFIHDLTEDPEEEAIVKAIIQLGHTLQLTTIAEGVETEAQLLALSAMGCDEYQGFLFSRPCPAEDFPRLSQQKRPCRVA